MTAVLAASEILARQDALGFQAGKSTIQPVAIRGKGPAPLREIMRFQEGVGGLLDEPIQIDSMVDVVSVIRRCLDDLLAGIEAFDDPFRNVVPNISQICANAATPSERF